MKNLKSIIITACLAMLIPSQCFSKEVRLWFIPMHFENSGSVTDKSETEMQAKWSQKFGADSRVRCENILNPMLKGHTGGVDSQFNT